mgnify:CR=1 FL=1
MRIHSESIIRHPRDAAFGAYRDRLSDIVPYLADIKEVRVLSRKEAPGSVTLHNLWVADREIPTFAKGFLKPHMLQWDDHAEWRDQERRCHWRLETFFKDGVLCSGTNTFLAIDPQTTRVVLEGELLIDLNKIPGVPRLLARRVGPQVEKFIVGLISPNLQKVNDSLQKFLDDQASG